VMLKQREQSRMRSLTSTIESAKATASSFAMRRT
jgi:hypothetical protein